MGVSCHACLGGTNVLAEVQKVNPIHILVKKEELRLGEGYLPVLYQHGMRGMEARHYVTCMKLLSSLWQSHSSTTEGGWLAHWEDAHLQLHHIHHRDTDQMEQDVIMREFCSGSRRVLMAHKLPESLMYSRFLLSSTMTFPWTVFLLISCSLSTISHCGQIWP